MKRLIFAIMMVGCVSTANASSFEYTPDPICSSFTLDELFQHPGEDGKGILHDNRSDGTAEYQINDVGALQYIILQGHVVKDQRKLNGIHKIICLERVKDTPISACPSVTVNQMFDSVDIKGVAKRSGDHMTVAINMHIDKTATPALGRYQFFRDNVRTFRESSLAKYIDQRCDEVMDGGDLYEQQAKIISNQNKLIDQMQGELAAKQ